MCVCVSGEEEKTRPFSGLIEQGWLFGTRLSPFFQVMSGRLPFLIQGEDALNLTYFESL